MHEATTTSVDRAMPEMLTFGDLQRVLKVSKRTVQGWRAAGHLPPADFELGRTIRWRPQTIERWLTEQRGADWRAADRN